VIDIPPTPNLSTKSTTSTEGTRQRYPRGGKPKPAKSFFEIESMRQLVNLGESKRDVTVTIADIAEFQLRSTSGSSLGGQDMYRSISMELPELDRLVLCRLCTIIIAKQFIHVLDIRTKLR
jgi:hypothetical protein